MNPRCPDNKRWDADIVGCGSRNTAQDPDEPSLWDCHDCGIWFDPDLEVALLNFYNQDREVLT